MEIPEFKFALTETLIENCKSYNNLDKSDSFDPNDFLPTKSEPAAVGYDVRCAELSGVDLVPQRFYKISLGFRAFIPEGWWAECVPRSSSFIKKHLHALYGVIDEHFPHPWMFCFQYLPDDKECICRNNLKRIEFGERIAQIIPVKRQDMQVSSVSNEELENLYSNRTTLRVGGFGSSGQK